jgi:hypothetical protein
MTAEVHVFLNNPKTRTKAARFVERRAEACLETLRKLNAAAGDNEAQRLIMNEARHDVVEVEFTTPAMRAANARGAAKVYDPHHKNEGDRTAHLRFLDHMPAEYIAVVNDWAARVRADKSLYMSPEFAAFAQKYRRVFSHNNKD